MDSQDEIRDRYASEAKSYREDAIVINFDANRLFEEMSKILDAFYPNQDEELNVLDIGAGNGMLTELVYKKYKEANYTMLDFSKEMLDSSLICFKENNLNIKVKHIVSDFILDDFPNEKYDLIISSYALHHVRKVSDLEHVYKKIASHLKDNGLFICIDNYLGETKEDRLHQIEVALDKWEESYNSREKALEWGSILETEDSPATLKTIMSLLNRIEGGTPLLINEHGVLATIYGLTKIGEYKLKEINLDYLTNYKQDKNIIAEDETEYCIDNYKFSKKED